MSTKPLSLTQAKTVGEWRRAATKVLEENRFESPSAEANALAAFGLTLSQLDLTLARDRELSPREHDRLWSLLQKRLGHVPLQYLVGTVDFAGISIRVRPGVFIPRPETEGLVDRVLDFLAPASPGTVVEVGTGSGAIALALASALPELQVRATDCSSLAVALALENQESLGLGNRVQFLEGDLTDPVHGDPALASLQAVVSNPPYVSEHDRGRLAPEVVDHEPHRALFADNKGMAEIERLVPRAAELLFPGGLLALEIGEDQGDRVLALLADSDDWREPRIETDLAGKDRYALAYRR